MLPHYVNYRFSAASVFRIFCIKHLHNLTIMQRILIGKGKQISNIDLHAFLFSFCNCILKF